MLRSLYSLALFFIILQNKNIMSGGFRLLLVRHAQSMNNVIAAEVAAKATTSNLNQKQLRAEVRLSKTLILYLVKICMQPNQFESRRSFDPELSETGTNQAEALGSYISKEFGHLEDVPVFVSPMVRTILTAVSTASFFLYISIKLQLIRLLPLQR